MTRRESVPIFTATVMPGINGIVALLNFTAVSSSDTETGKTKLSDLNMLPAQWLKMDVVMVFSARMSWRLR